MARRSSGSRGSTRGRGRARGRTPTSTVDQPFIGTPYIPSSNSYPGPSVQQSEQPSPPDGHDQNAQGVEERLNRAAEMIQVRSTID